MAWIACLYPNDTVYHMNACNNHGTVTATASWNPDRVNHTCQVTAVSWQSLPTSYRAETSQATVEWACPYLPIDSTAGKALIIATALVIALLLCVSLVVIHYRRHPVIKASSFTWSLVFLLGAMVLSTSSFTNVGERTHVRCIGFMTLGSMGWVSMLAAITVKKARVYRIYTSLQLRVETITNVQLLPLFLLLVLANVVCLTIWSLTAGTIVGYSDVQSTIDRPWEMQVEPACSVGNTSLLIVWLALLMVLPSLNVILSWRVPARFSETYKLSAMAVIMTVCIVVTVSLLLTVVVTEASRSLVKSILGLFLSVVSVTLYFGPLLCRQDTRGETNAENWSVPGTALSPQQVIVCPPTTLLQEQDGVGSVRVPPPLNNTMVQIPGSPRRFPRHGDVRIHPSP